MLDIRGEISIVIDGGQGGGAGRDGFAIVSCDPNLSKMLYLQEDIDQVNGR